MAAPLVAFGPDIDFAEAHFAPVCRHRGAPRVQVAPQALALPDDGRMRARPARLSQINTRACAVIYPFRPAAALPCSAKVRPR